MVFAPESNGWLFKQLSGNAWNDVRSELGRRYIKNTYRVLLTRAREGLVIWVPEGEAFDQTRKPEELTSTFDFTSSAARSRNRSAL